MNEHVLRAVLWRDESKPLGCVEPLDGPDLGVAGPRPRDAGVVAACWGWVGACEEREVFRRIAAVAARSWFEADPLPFPECAEPCVLERGDVDEDVVRAIVRRDEAVPGAALSLPPWAGRASRLR